MVIDPTEGIIKQGLEGDERYRYEERTAEGDLVFRHETKGYGVITYVEDSSEPKGFKPLRTVAANIADDCIAEMKKCSKGDLSKWCAIVPPDKPILP